MPSTIERPELEQIALAYAQAESLLMPVVGELPRPHPEDQKVPSSSIDSLSFTHLVFTDAHRRIKVTGAGRPDALDANVPVEKLLDAVGALVEGGWGYLAAIVGVDLGLEEGEFEVLYLFFEGAAVLALAVRVPRGDARVPSVCGIIPSASFFERELSEMFGITVVGTPNPARLFLPDEWPVGVYPLRKDFEVEARLVEGGE